MTESNQLQSHDAVISSVRHWVDSVVVELELCPFAKRELLNSRVRFVTTQASTEELLLSALEAELELLVENDAIETTLLIHPAVLQNFEDYNQFLNQADGLIALKALEGCYQIASFHPDSRFASTAMDDAENYSNRSPYPMLHLLREASVEAAVASYPNAEKIPQRNIQRLKEMGTERLHALLNSCFDLGRNRA